MPSLTKLARAAGSIFPLELREHLIKQRGMTSLFPSYRHRRNARKIEIDITYQCNLKCRQCNRSCPQAPSREQMSVEQIQKFVRESLREKIEWKSIMVIGGEPTLHPQLTEILIVLIDYQKKYSPECTIIFATNGVGGYAKKVMERIPKGVSIRNSTKDIKVQHPEGYAHEPFNEAPQDSLLHRFSDYTYGCAMTSYCGTGLTPYGYYVCPIAGGGIDRVFGFDVGRKEIPKTDDQMNEQRIQFCRLCGHFKGKQTYNTDTLSSTWKEAYRMFSNSQPALTRY